MTWTTHDRDTDHHGTEKDSVIAIDGDLPYSYGDDGTLLHAALSAMADTLGMVLFGTADPTSGAGVAHRMPATYLQNDSGTVRIWTPTGTGATSWQEVAASVASLDLTDQGSDPSAPASGEHLLYAKSGGVYVRDPGGTVVGPLGTGGGGGGVTVQDEGTPLATAADTIDFVGAGVVASGTGTTKTVTISGAAVADILDIPTAEMDPALVLAPVGDGTLEFRAESGGGGGGSDLIPTIVHYTSSGVNGTSLAVAISAAASGNRLIVVVASNLRDVNTPTCTNVTFTEVMAVNYSTTIYLSVYVGVVAGGPSDTTLTVTAVAGSANIFAQVYEVADALTPTAGTSGTLTDTNTQAVLLKPWGIIAPTKGTFFVAACAQDSATTAMPLIVRSACYGANHFGPMASAIGYAPGGTLSAFILAGTANADWCAGIVPIT